MVWQSLHPGAPAMLLPLALCAIHGAMAVGAADPAALRDHPPVGHSQRYLDGAWEASASGGAGAARTMSMNATVPGDIITDLEAAGLVGDPWFETNWRDDAGVWFRPPGLLTQGVPGVPLGTPSRTP
jgi:hypothetical protein